MYSIAQSGYEGRKNDGAGGGRGGLQNGRELDAQADGRTRGRGNLLPLRETRVRPDERAATFTVDSNLASFHHHVFPLVAV